ncbi:MAG: glycerol-3-phosphate dehydrogenase/oxidase [Nevskia sp.]|nr:glycerol-3-phosphate dehydrogenase/oxidase [Nevskia sp.]
MTAAFPLRRNVAGLRDGEFDLLVVGGGIYGAWTACDAALRGLRVALVEKVDWGAGTSSASSKLIHGGLRYLEHFEFGLVRHALAERRVLSRIAPHLVRPLNFLVPVWRNARVGRMQLLAGLTLYDFLATGKQPVPRFKSYSRSKLLGAHPYLDGDGLRGGLRYGDCQEDDARMTLFVVAAAQAAGAVCANRVEATALLEQDGRVVGARLRDAETGASFELRAGCVVNAAGPWARALVGAGAPGVKLVKGIHLVLPAVVGCEEAFLLTAPQDGRVFFVIPWYGRTLLGTTEAEVRDPADAVVTPDETHYLLQATQALLPGLRWSAGDVIGGFAGVRTLQPENGASLSAVSREFAVLEPKPRLLWPVGGKYTTARCDAAELVDQVLQRLGRTPVPCQTSRRPLPGAPMEAAGLGEFTGWQAEAMSALLRRGIDEEAARFLTLRHGTGLPRLHVLLDQNPAWAARLHPEAPFLVAEAVLAVREEMARDADDVLRRRMPLSLLVRDTAAARRQVEQLLRDDA